jgi:hypothetical protein
VGRRITFVLFDFTCAQRKRQRCTLFRFQQDIRAGLLPAVSFATASVLILARIRQACGGACRGPRESTLLVRCKDRPYRQKAVSGQSTFVRCNSWTFSSRRCQIVGTIETRTPKLNWSTGDFERYPQQQYTPHLAERDAVEFGRELINSEWSANVRFGAHPGLP